MHGRHKIGAQALAPATPRQRHAVGPGHDGQEPTEELPLQQPLRQCDLPQPVCVCRPLDGV